MTQKKKIMVTVVGVRTGGLFSPTSIVSEGELWFMMRDSSLPCEVHFRVGYGGLLHFIWPIYRGQNCEEAHELKRTILNVDQRETDP